MKTKERKPTKPKVEFNLYFAPRHYPDYVTLMVHKNQADMMTHRRDRKSSTCEAFFKPTDLEETLKVNPDGSEARIVNNCYGEIHFFYASLGLGIIAHELYHVVTNWAWEHSCIPTGNEQPESSNGIIYLPCNEERCAELMGSLMAQSIVGLAKHATKAFTKAFINIENERSFVR